MPKRLAAPRARVMTRFDALSLRCLSAKRGMRGAKRPRPVLVGSLSAPRLRRYVEPLPLAYRLFRGTPIRPAEMDPGFPTQAGGRRAPEVVRYTGRSG